MKTLRSVELLGPDAMKCDILVDDNALDALTTEEIHELSIDASFAIDSIMEKIRLCRVKKEKGRERRQCINEYLDCVQASGLQCSWYDIVPNEYSNSSYYWTKPWIIAYTSIGPLKIGWRKRVIVLDWEKTLIKKGAEQLFPDEDVTKDGRMIHCWGYHKLTDYITKLKGNYAKST